MKLTIVILNWNGKLLLKKFLPKIILYTPKTPIYIVDNSSKDGSIEFINKEYKDIRIIKLPKNTDIDDILTGAIKPLPLGKYNREELEKKFTNNKIYDVKALNFPFETNYNKENLGVDRIGLIIAAINKFPKEDCLVIDAWNC